MRMPADRDKVLAALASAGAAGLTQTQISYDILRHRSRADLEELLEGLHGEGLVARHRMETPTVDRPTIRWQLKEAISHAAERAESNGAQVASWTPALGEGWVAWSDVIYIAEAGVPRGYALRQGKHVAIKQRRRNKTRRRLEPKLTDEQRGIRHVAHKALASAVRSGFIERRGEWCRLLRDPVRSQRPWMEAVYNVLGDAHSTLTGRWQPKPRKTLASVMQAHVGRTLFPDEFVRRLPGRAGSWDPEDLEICTRLRAKSASRPSARKALEDYLQARLADTAAPQEWKQFHVQLPRKRGADLR